jgi:predicted  nucleic acid-binding Zn-ribbon protein
LFVFDLAVALRKRGHQPIAFSTVLGDVADLLRSAAIPVIDDPGALTVAPDVIHGQHHLELATTLLRFPETPAIHVCHGWLPWEEQPLRFPTIQRYVAVSNLTRERLLTSGVPPERIELVPNFVDTERFRPRRPLTGPPATAAVFSNYMGHEHPHFQTIAAACAQLNFDRIDLIGGAAGTATSVPEEVLPGYDVVFAAGRCALEAMASGCAVIVTDHHGFAGLVTLDNLEELRSGNFGIATTYGKPPTLPKIVAEIGKIAPSQIEAVSGAVRDRASLASAVTVWEQLYLQALAAHDRSVTPERIMMAASEYVRNLNPAIKNRHAEWRRLVERYAVDQQRVSSAEAALVEAQEHAAALVAKTEQDVALLSQARTTIATLEAALADEEERANDLSRRLDGYPERLAEAQATTEEATAAAANAEQRIGTIESALQKAQQESTVLQARAKHADLRVWEIGATLDKLDTELARERSRNAALESMVKQTEEHLAALRATLEQTTADLTTAKDGSAALAASLAQREREIALAKQRIAQIKASVSYHLMAPFRELYRPVRRLRASRLGSKLSAAWHHPLSSRKRKEFRARQGAPLPPPRDQNARPSKGAARVRALMRYPFSPNLRRAYRERLRNGPLAAESDPRCEAPLAPLMEVPDDTVELVRNSFLFDAKFYVSKYLQPKRVDTDPVRHYLNEGARAGFNPGPLFDTRRYVAAYPDVVAADINPLVHYLAYGCYEGRLGWDLGIARELQAPYFLDPEAALAEIERHTSANEPPTLQPGDHVYVLTSSLGNSFFHHIQLMLCAAFRQLHVEAVPLNENDEIPRAPGLKIIVAPHEFFYLGRGRSFGHSSRYSDAVLINTEQFQTGWFSRALPYLERAPRVLDINLQTAAVLSRLGLPSRFLPLGYVEEGCEELFDGNAPPDEPSLAALGSPRFSPAPQLGDSLRHRPIDLTFVGGTSDRREAFFAENAASFAKSTCFLHLADSSAPIHSTAAVSARGFSSLVRRSKLLLNLHRSDLPYFEWHRIVLFGLWQGAAVVTERSSRAPILEPGKHYFEATLKELPDLIEWLLYSAEGRMQADLVAKAGYESLRANFSLKRSLAALFQISPREG